MATPLVAIVGRPNVGKSTLFNRIIRRQKAIVDAQPGVTRDRHYATAEWGGKTFTIADTGGFIIHGKDDIDRGIKAQVEEAIEESDVVILLTDVKSGITDVDKTMSDMLLKSEKPVVLVVNKVDGFHEASETGAFFSLGLGDPVGISAMHGRCTGDLLDRIVSLFPESAETPPEEPQISVAILGKPNVGKSSFVNALLGKEKMLVTDIPGTTRDSVDSYIKRNGIVYRLIDTAGLRKRARIHESIEYYSTLRTIRSIDQCEVAIILVDAQDGVQMQDLKIIDMVVEAQRGIIVALNKWDLVKQNEKTYIETEQQTKEKLIQANYIQVLSTSALKKVRVFKTLDLCAHVFGEWTKKIETRDLNKVIQKAIEQNHPPAFRGKPVTIKYCTQTGTAPPVITMFINHPQGINEQYKRYLLHAIRNKYKFEGVPITIQIRKK